MRYIWHPNMSKSIWSSILLRDEGHTARPEPSTLPDLCKLWWRLLVWGTSIILDQSRKGWADCSDCRYPLELGWNFTGKGGPALNNDLHCLQCWLLHVLRVSSCLGDAAEEGLDINCENNFASFPLLGVCWDGLFWNPKQINALVMFQ